MKQKLLLLATSLLLITTLPACKKDKGSPPALPLYGSMAIDFSLFTDPGKKGELPEGDIKDIPDPDENFSFSAQMAAIWSNILYIDLAVPVEAFRQAHNKAPSWIDDKTWEWEFAVTGIPGTYNARLVGKKVAGGTEWEMFISKEGDGAFDDFLWFTGQSSEDGLSGSWTFSANAQFQQPLLQIDWIRSGNTISQVKYTYIREVNDAGQPDLFKTSYIEYGRLTGTYDFYFDIRIYEPLVIEDFVTVLIEWNSATGAGRVKALHKFSDEEWHCWDNEKFNIDCPS